MSPAKANPCPSRQVSTKSVVDFWSENPKCPHCVSTKKIGGTKVSVGGATTGSGGIKHGPDWLLLSAAGEWIVLTHAEHEHFQQELAAFEATLSQEATERDLALARFYGDRGLELMRIQLLDHALVTAQYPDPHIAMGLAEALERAGFIELALQTWDAVPVMIAEHDMNVPVLLGKAMLNRGRILESLERPFEAENAFAVAQHMSVLAEQLRR